MLGQREDDCQGLVRPDASSALESFLENTYAILRCLGKVIKWAILVENKISLIGLGPFHLSACDSEREPK